MKFINIIIFYTEDRKQVYGLPDLKCLSYASGRL